MPAKGEPPRVTIRFDPRPDGDQTIEPAQARSEATAARTITKNFPALNGLRFLAALAVVCFHYCPPVSWQWLNSIFASGPAAVGFFFLLSGFVLALHHPGVPSERKFWRARLLRIYPMYIFAFLLFLPLAFEKYHHDPKMFLASAAVNITMLQAWTTISQSWNGPSWSLSVEAFLYFTFPFLVRLMARRAGEGRRVALWAALALAPSLLTLGFCARWIPAAMWRGWIGNNPVFWLPLFSFGIALGLWRDRANPAGKRSMDTPVFALLGIIVLFAVFWPAQDREMLINGGTALFLGVLVLLCTYRAPIANRVLGNPAMDRLGKASYITYIVQAPLWHYFLAFVNFLKHRPLAEEHATLPVFLSFVAVLIGASLFLDAFVDEPVRSWFNRKRQAVSTVPAPAVATETSRVA